MTSVDEPAADLAVLTNASLSRLSHLIKRLEARGYVRRQADTQLPSCLLPDPVQVAEDVSPPRNRTEVEQLVHRLAPQYAIDPQLVLAVISTESSFNPRAVSPKNAQGLMQLIPETAERFGVKQVFSPVENIKGGLAYLRSLLAFFQGDVPLVLAAYNAGENNVVAWGGSSLRLDDIPFPETRGYVESVLDKREEYAQHYRHELGLD